MCTPEQYLPIAGLTSADIEASSSPICITATSGTSTGFPNAKVFVYRSEPEYWERASRLPNKYRWLTSCLEPNDIQAIQDLRKQSRLVLTADESEILPGLTAHLTLGHTRGGQALRVVSDDNVYVLANSTLFTQRNIARMVPIGFGHNYEEMLFSFDKLLLLAGGEPIRIIPSHDSHWSEEFYSARMIEGSFTGYRYVTLEI